MGTRALLSYREFAELVGVSEITAKRWGAAGQIPVIRIGRTCRVPSSYIDELAATARESTKHNNRA